MYLFILKSITYVFIYFQINNPINPWPSTSHFSNVLWHSTLVNLWRRDFFCFLLSLFSACEWFLFSCRHVRNFLVDSTKLQGQYFLSTKKSIKEELNRLHHPHSKNLSCSTSTFISEVRLLHQQKYKPLEWLSLNQWRNRSSTCLIFACELRILFFHDC